MGTSVDALRIRLIMMVLCVAGLGGALGASAKDLSVDELRAAQAKMKSSDSLTVDFVQTKFSHARSRSTQRQGKALFVKPNLFKWMLAAPVREYKIYDGKYLFDYDPETNTATRYPPDGSQAYQLRQVIDLVLNVDSLLKRYDLVKAESDGDLIKIFLHPKTPGDVVGIELHLAQKEEFISYLKMDLSDKNSLTHEFKNPSRAPIPESAFDLPKGVKINDIK